MENHPGAAKNVKFDETGQKNNILRWCQFIQIHFYMGHGTIIQIEDIFIGLHTDIVWKVTLKTFIEDFWTWPAIFET